MVPFAVGRTFRISLKTLKNTECCFTVLWFDRASIHGAQPIFQAVRISEGDSAHSFKSTPFGTITGSGIPYWRQKSGSSSSAEKGKHRLALTQRQGKRPEVVPI